ncbi:DMT family transporter [Marinobacterium aestuariivivens]|uniref:DMT family transporter n=1 Tax=Marinobacterium aestuariivivens TaxID=1698799 RepID=A0ABW2A1U1_9GAMM
MDNRQPLDIRATGLMLVLCLTWSLQQIFLKATAEDFSPVLQIALRSGISAGLVGAFVWLRGSRLDFGDGSWRPGLLAGVLFALEFLLVGQAVQYTTASHLVVFLYTAPVFAALGLHWQLPSERLAPLQWTGIALAFGGIATTFLGRDEQAVAGGLSSMLWGDVLALAAGAAWGATTVVIRITRLAYLPATQTLLYQLVTACVLLLLVALVSDQTTFNPTPLVWTSLAFQSVLVAFASFLIWFWLLRHYLASRLGVFSFLTPLLGVLLGAWLLGEPVESGFLLGALLVLGGILLVSGHELLKQRFGAIRNRLRSNTGPT